MTTRQAAILGELAWLCDDAPEYARGGNESGWLPFHVRWFRSGKWKGHEVRPNDELLRETTEDVIKCNLDALVKQGLAAKIRPRGFGQRTVYWVTDKGREFLRNVQAVREELS